MAVNLPQESMLKVISEIVIALAGATSENTEAILSLSNDDKDGALNHLSNSSAQLRKIYDIAQENIGKLEALNG